jgi:putative MATE family efflux protein
MTALDDAERQNREKQPEEKSGLSANLATGSLMKAIWSMSWPLMVTTVSASLVGLADMHVAGFLGSASQAAVGVSEQVLFILMIFIMSTGVGTQALVSRATGAEDQKEAARATGQSLLFAVIMGVLLLLAAKLGAHKIVGFFARTDEVADIGATYLSIYALYLIPFSLLNIINAAFRAIGDSRTTLIIMLVSTSLNIAGDYATVLHDWPVAGLGVEGIAWAAVVGNIVGAIVAVFFLLRSPLKTCTSYMFPFIGSVLGRIVKIGIPAALQRLGWGLSTFVIFFILRCLDHPTEALAAWTIGIRVEGLVFMPLMALSLAVASIVGQNLGAQQEERAFKAGWHVTFIGMAMMLLCCALLIFFADTLSSVMTKDPATAKITASYIRYNAVGGPFLALAMVLGSALQGAGDTKTPMVISYIANWVIRLPVAYGLAIVMKMGSDGAWLSMTLSVAVMGVLTALRYQSKAWLKTQV